MFIECDVTSVKFEIFVVYDDVSPYCIILFEGSSVLQFICALFVVVETDMLLIVKVCVNVAVKFLLSFIIMFIGFVVVFMSPVHLSKNHPFTGVAVKFTFSLQE